MNYGLWKKKTYSFNVAHQLLYNRIKNHTKKQGSLLDIGCGNSWMIRKLSQDNQLNCTGIDPFLNKNQLKTDSGYVLIHGIFPDDIVNNHTFDYILSVEQLYLVNQPEHYFEGIQNHLKENGTAIFYSYLARKDLEKMNTWIEGFDIRFLPNPTELKKLIGRCQLTVLKINDLSDQVLPGSLRFYLAGLFARLLPNVILEKCLGLTRVQIQALIDQYRLLKAKSWFYAEIILQKQRV
jgi:cyclopropane fatty-acyl-phospholipid synthase-like methyltransferase